MQPRLKYGLTIQLNTKDVTLPEQPQGSSTNSVEANGAVITALDEHTLKHKTNVFEQDVFSEYQERNAKKGLLIHVHAGHEATVNLKRELRGDCVYHILVLVEHEAKLTLIDEYTGNPDLHVGAVEIIAYQDAHVKYATMQKLESGNDFVNYRARGHQDAQIDWFIGQFGADLSRAVVDTELVGTNGNVRSYGVYMGDEKQQFDRSDAVMHKGNQTSSDMHSKGVLRGASKAVFRGTIDIDAEAFGCDGYQKNHTLLLSGEAVADAIPNLEIRNNDVKCSHGATIGRVDDEHLFYLTSRGIDEETATHMLVEGFFAELTEALKWEELTQKVLATAKEALE